ncbi:MAG: choice-of-anchor I family protein [Candidatus Limnocylindria bacterium]
MRLSRLVRPSLAATLLAVATIPPAAAGSPQSIELELLGRYESGIFGASAAEITAFDARSGQLFVVNAAQGRLDVLSLADPSDPTPVGVIDTSAFGPVVNSVAVHHGLVAVAVEAAPKTDPGTVAFYRSDGTFVRAVEVGALPDMLTYTPDGRHVLVANEGEPNDAYTVDPEGSISIIEVATGAVRTVGFEDFNEGGPRHAELDPRIRIFGPGASVAQDLEPEYVTVSHDGRWAWAVLQENNALAIIDLETAVVDSLVALGFKDHSLPGHGIDASDRDGAINITTWPVYGMYLPDGIASYRSRGQTYLVTANEGDARAWAGYEEEARVNDLDLDPIAFPDAEALQEDEALGRLTVTTANGDVDGDGEFEELYAFGARSLSIWTADGSLVWDSGEDLEQITAVAYPDHFNSNHEEGDSFDNRSDNKGPEPEDVEIGQVRGRTYAFVGLERMGGVVVYDVTDPRGPSFVTYQNDRDFGGDPEAGTAGDLGAEGVLFIPASDSPIPGTALLVVAHEISGSVAVYAVSPTR